MGTQNGKAQNPSRSNDNLRAKNTWRDHCPKWEKGDRVRSYAKKKMIYILWCSYILKGMPIGYSVKFYWDLWGNE